MLQGFSGLIMAAGYWLPSRYQPSTQASPSCPVLACFSYPWRSSSLQLTTFNPRWAWRKTAKWLVQLACWAASSAPAQKFCMTRAAPSTRLWSGSSRSWPPSPFSPGSWGEALAGGGGRLGLWVTGPGQQVSKRLTSNCGWCFQRWPISLCIRILPLSCPFTNNSRQQTSRAPAHKAAASYYFLIFFTGNNTLGNMSERCNW